METLACGSVSTAFLVLPNLQSCKSIRTRKMFFQKYHDCYSASVFLQIVFWDFFCLVPGQLTVFCVARAKSIHLAKLPHNYSLKQVSSAQISRKRPWKILQRIINNLCVLTKEKWFSVSGQRFIFFVLNWTNWLWIALSSRALNPMWSLWFKNRFVRAWLNSIWCSHN